MASESDIVYRSMQLSLQSQTVGDIVVIRCRGRIVSGDEARTLQAEIDRLTALTKSVVLQLSEVTYVDSGGLGALVRIYGVLRAARGDLKVCQLSPFVEQVLQATNLLEGIGQPFASEKEAIRSTSRAARVCARCRAAIHGANCLPR